MKYILIVDDAATNLRILEILLKKCGCEVSAFTSPEDCLSWSKNHIQDVDLVIVDYQMPGMNGDKLGAELRKIGCTCHIIMLTAHSGLSKSTVDAEARIAGIMNKPISFGDVNYMVKRWSVQDQTMDVRREVRVDIANRQQEIFLYKDGAYMSINAICVNQSENGVSFLLESNNSGLISTGDEIVLKNGINYSIRWSRQRDEGQYVGGCSIIP